MNSPFWRSVAFFVSAAVVAVYAVLGAHAFASPAQEPAVRATSTTPTIVIVMENHERSSIESSPDADYLKSFEAAGRSFTHYYATTHPSLPNYLAFSSGGTDGKTGSDSVNAGEIQATSFWKQLSTHSIPWKVYMEDMPSACYSGGSSGNYVLRHNPATVYHDVFAYPKRCAKVVPFSQFSTSSLPRFSFVIPNLCNDMHDCSIATGDNWLAAHVPAMLSAGAEVIITFDEGSTSTNGGGNVYTAIRGPGIGASVNTGTFNHYGFLAALEKRAGVPKLQNAAGAAVLPIG
jgi:phosphatidylinositol-3-phosphatase